MQWLFELSVVCAISALAITPLIKILFDAPVQRRRRQPLKTAAFQALVPIPVTVAPPSRGAQS